jgi:Spy/CpxP family protein refolding chaperone
MKTRTLSICALLLALAGSARAQQPGLTPQPAPNPGPAPQAAPQPGDDPIGRSFFPPELVMQHQEAIGLTAEQKEYLKTEIRQAQVKFTELQWKLQDEGEKLLSIVRQPRIDEQQLLAQLDRVLAAERDVKRAQVSLVTRIKNRLTPQQQARLEELRRPPR